MCAPHHPAIFFFLNQIAFKTSNTFSSAVHAHPVWNIQATQDPGASSCPDTAKSATTEVCCTQSLGSQGHPTAVLTSGLSRTVEENHSSCPLFPELPRKQAQQNSWGRTTERTGKVGRWRETHLVFKDQYRSGCGELKSGTVLISRESKNSGKMVSARRAETNTQREHQAPSLQ